MSVPTFDYAAWVARYPELVDVSQSAAQGYFNESLLEPLAQRVVNEMADSGQQLMLLGMLVAHLAKLYSTIGGVAPSDLVGQINSAGEGSVSVGVFINPNRPQSADWFMQTKYGAQFWRYTAGWRTAVYRRYNRPMPSGGPFPGGWN